MKLAEHAGLAEVFAEAPVHLVGADGGLDEGEFGDEAGVLQVDEAAALLLGEEAAVVHVGQDLALRVVGGPGELGKSQYFSYYLAVLFLNLLLRF